MAAGPISHTNPAVLEPGGPPIRLVLVDDHELVRQGLRALLEAHDDIAVVGEAGSVAEGLRRVGFGEPDVVLLDLNLPDGTGIDACRRILRISADIKVLILTAFADEAALAASRAAGACGFILKRVGGGEIIDTIRRTMSGDTSFQMSSSPATPSDDTLLNRLTERERSILELIAEGKTNREIAEELYLAEKTVKNYVSNLLLKMGMKHRAGAAAHLARVRAMSEHHYPPSDWPSGS